VKDNKHIQSFNEHQENLNISDVINSKLNEYYQKRYKAEQNFNNKYYPKKMEDDRKRLNENFISDISNLFN
jgi:hypothetical protein